MQRKFYLGKSVTSSVHISIIEAIEEEWMKKKDFTLQPTALTGDEPSTGVGLKRLLGCRLKLCIVYRRKDCGFFVL